ncbi:MAG: TetR/AcrR family transcriptional regulator [Halobacteriovoraceae bacterium]|nr:TetR/AcrR family transcriptional regulator [Halobacteriovoraceae bacterium]MCB9095333.1 TetR/AcrR family transcriptional regulator [Halobacteriovoraceae bacterium]
MSENLKIKTKARKKPQQKRSQKLVSYILSGTVKALKTFGIDGLSTNKISKMAGVSVGSYYQYFPNKEAVLSKVADEIVSKTKKNILEAMNPQETIELKQRIDQIIDYSVNEFLKNDFLIRDLTAIVFMLKKHDSIIQTRQEIINSTADILENEFEVPTQNASRLAYTLINAFIGNVHTYALTKDEKKPFDVIQLKQNLSELYVTLIKEFQKDTPHTNA